MICILHKWSDWSDLYQAKEVRQRGSFGGTSDDDVIYQDRECERCGKVKTRFVRDGKLNGENNE